MREPLGTEVCGATCVRLWADWGRVEMLAGLWPQVFAFEFPLTVSSGSLLSFYLQGQQVP